MCRLNATGTTRPLSTKRESTGESSESDSVIRNPSFPLPFRGKHTNSALSGTHHTKAPTIPSAFRAIWAAQGIFPLANEPKAAGRTGIFEMIGSYTNKNLPTFVLYRIGLGMRKDDRRLIFAIYRRIGYKQATFGHI